MFKLKCLASTPANICTYSAAPPLVEVAGQTEIGSHAPPESSRSSLVEVDTPHVASIPSTTSESEFGQSSQSYSYSSQTQSHSQTYSTTEKAKQKARETVDTAKDVYSKESKKVQEKIKQSEQQGWIARVKENPVLLGNAIVTAAIGATIGWGAYRRFSRGEEFSTGTIGTAVGVLGAVAAADIWAWNQYSAN